MSQELHCKINKLKRPFASIRHANINLFLFKDGLLEKNHMKEYTLINNAVDGTALLIY